MRVIGVVALVLGLILAMTTPAWAAPSVSIDSGPSGPTNDTMPLFGFTVDLGATVECSIVADQATPAYGPCSGVGTHAPDTPLGDGDYVFWVRATDALLEQTEASQSFSVDTAAPSLSIDSGPSGPTNDATPSFGFATEGGATVECSIDQGTPAYGSCSGATTHAPGAPLADGSYVFRVRATDAAGNQASSQQAFSVDTAAPSLSIDSGPSGPTSVTAPSFGFTAEPGARLECSVDQGTPAYGPCTTTSSHTATSLVDGSYVFRVRATDVVGNQAELSQGFVVDTVAPAVDVVSGPTVTRDPTPSFGFTAEPGARLECSVDQGTPAYGPCSGATSHDVGVSLPDGDYTFRIRATDRAGNQAGDSRDFTVDSEAPSLSIDSGPAGPTSETAPSFGFTAEVGTTVECSVDQGTPAYGPCSGATSHAVGTPLPDGSYTFRVRATDRAANEASDSRDFTVDTTPPLLSIDSGPSGTTSDSTPVFGFTIERGVTVECSLDQGTPAYGPCTGASAYAAVLPLADGAYIFRVQATDAAGNQTSVTRAFTVDTAPQTPAPEAPTPEPTPPAAPPVTPTPSKPQLLSPFPLVRISGTLTPAGARIRLLTVRAAAGTLVRVTVTPCSGKRRSSRRCRVRQASGTVGRSAVIGFRALARAYRSGTVIVVRVWRADRIGKYTRFTILRGKAPRRIDECLMPGATRGSRCPSE